MTGTVSWVLNSSKIKSIVSGIASVGFDDEGNLVIKLTDGTEIKRAFKDIKAVSVDEDKHMIVTYSDNTIQDVGLIEAKVKVSDVIYVSETAPPEDSDYILWINTAENTIGDGD